MRVYSQLQLGAIAPSITGRPYCACGLPQQDWPRHALLPSPAGERAGCPLLDAPARPWRRCGGGQWPADLDGLMASWLFSPGPSRPLPAGALA